MYERSRAGGYNWLHFATRSGDAGRAWVEAYRDHETVVRRSDQALKLLRGRRIEGGRDVLERMAEDLAAIDASPNGTPASVRWVLERWYQGTRGYLHYCLDEHDDAERAMDRAHAAVSQAIGSRTFLLPLANHCHEFCLHQARVARNRRRWDEMFDRVEQAREMICDRRPLCETIDGERIYLSTIRRYFEGLGSLDPAERQALQFYFDDALRFRLFERFVRRLVVLPGFAIPSP